MPRTPKWCKTTTKTKGSGNKPGRKPKKNLKKDDNNVTADKSQETPNCDTSLETLGKDSDLNLNNDVTIANNKLESNTNAEQMEQEPQMGEPVNPKLVIKLKANVKANFVAAANAVLDSIDNTMPASINYDTLDSTHDSSTSVADSQTETMSKETKNKTVSPKKASTGESYNCEKCGKTFKDLAYLRHHVKRKHVGEIEMLTEIETKRALVRRKKLRDRKQDLVACPVCGLGFQKHAKGIIAHITKVNKNIVLYV